MEGMYLVPLQAAHLASKIGQEAFVAPELSRRWIWAAPYETITTLLGRLEISSTTPSRDFV